MNINEPGENTGSSVTQNKSIPCEADGPVYNISLIVKETVTDKILFQENHGYGNTLSRDRAKRQALYALRGEVLMMFVTDDIIASFDALIHGFRDDGFTVKNYTIEQVDELATELNFDSDAQGINEYIYDTVYSWIKENLVADDE